ncbi:aldehyde oxidase 1 [Striga asiatica]|uniref:Aldehyde oxidase 1 n=1 Tax=Striga asiatica TaxID=4170 RepID=A0A5A7QQS8_STRAF|nr:aldehyde oxidase 1 [Striga asiatica]
MMWWWSEEERGWVERTCWWRAAELAVGFLFERDVSVVGLSSRFCGFPTGNHSGLSLLRVAALISDLWPLTGASVADGESRPCGSGYSAAAIPYGLPRCFQRRTLTAGCDGCWGFRLVHRESPVLNNYLGRQPIGESTRKYVFAFEPRSSGKDSSDSSEHQRKYEGHDHVFKSSGYWRISILLIEETRRRGEGAAVVVVGEIRKK